MKRRCNCRQWLTCVADEWSHRLRLPFLGWLCQRHDRNIIGDDDD